MAFYHVGGCDCPMGNCDCGDSRTDQERSEDCLVGLLDAWINKKPRSRQLWIHQYINDWLVYNWMYTGFLPIAEDMKEGGE